MASERDDLVEQMRLLAEKGRELAAEHAKVVEEFLRVQDKVIELDHRINRTLTDSN